MTIPLCPYLPFPQKEMSYRNLSELCGGNIEAFYLTALSYGHYLWLKGYSGRAILAITRALYANLLPRQKSFANGHSHIEPCIGSLLITLAKIIPETHA